MMETATELVGKESVVATWNLLRSGDWKELRKPLEEESKGVRRSGSGRAGDAEYVFRYRSKLTLLMLSFDPFCSWLAQAELSTFSKSTRVVPRSIYLSHQFSFHMLGEDYHALIRRYKLDIGGPKIDVRKEVEISAFSVSAAGDAGESFVEGFSAPRDMRRISSSFDEPLASALAGGFEHANPPAVLPMLPNGTPGSLGKQKLFRNSIPIRTTMAGIGDGMSESLGRFKREMNKARSPPLAPMSDNTSTSALVPLEFDEEDEDFVLRDTLEVPDRDDDAHSQTTSKDADSGPTVSTPATSTHPLDEVEAPTGDDVWQDWGEPFDHISAVGFLDEEHEQQQEQQRIAKAGSGLGKKKNRKKRM